jgi:hypothetical protein
LSELEFFTAGLDLFEKYKDDGDNICFDKSLNKIDCPADPHPPVVMA